MDSDDGRNRLGGCGVFVIRRWALSSGWSDMHRWALVFCAVLVCMIAGFSGSGGWPQMDIIGKGILNVIAVAGFIWLAVKISGRSARSVETRQSRSGLIGSKQQVPHPPGKDGGFGMTCRRGLGDFLC